MALAQIMEESLSGERAAVWMNGFIAQAEALRMYDAELYPKQLDEENLRRARQLRVAWTEWVEQAEAALKRLDFDKLASTPVFKKFYGQLSHGRATIKLSPEQMHQHVAEAKRQKGFTVEEARRELFG